MQRRFDTWEILSNHADFSPEMRSPVSMNVPKNLSGHVHDGHYLIDIRVNGKPLSFDQICLKMFS